MTEVPVRCQSRHHALRTSHIGMAPAERQRQPTHYELSTGLLGRHASVVVVWGRKKALREVVEVGLFEDGVVS